MIRILIIDDNKQSIRDVQQRLDERDEFESEWCGGFDEAKAREKINRFLPNAVVLDLLEESTDGTPSAERSLKIDDFIWDVRFCPVIVYSAQPELYPEEHREHPFVRTVRKGMDSDLEVVKYLDELKPYIEALADAENHIRDSLALAMRDVAPYAFEAHSCTTTAKETTLRMGRRRLAALMDEMLIGDQSELRSWEMYLCPPVSTNIQLGDIIQDAHGGNDEPDSFRLVLSPSCDMVSNEDRAAKISHVLVARCCSIDQALSRLGLEEAKKGKLDPSRLGLPRGYIEEIVFLPKLSKRIPTMAANLKELVLIPIDQIASGQDVDDGSPHFVRVASIDSPFREAVMWAYLQSAGRPGLPDRDFEAWRGEIVAARKSK